MKLLFQWTVRLVSATLLLGVLALIMAYYLASRSLPDYTADHQVNGLSAPIEIVRNNSNVPHIFASADQDAYFGLGYAHAQDRLFQMVILRRTAQGRLSEVFGARTQRTDELMRRLDIYRQAQQAVAVQDAYTSEALTAYARGVNAWLDRVNQDALGRGAPEFFVFPGSLAPWVPADSIAILKLMGVNASSHIASEIKRAQVSLALPDDRVRDILPDAPGMGITALPQYADLFQPKDQTFAALLPGLQTPALYPVQDAPFASASNAWAAGPDRSATSGTLLAHDPHLAFSAPSPWYLARLELTSGGVIGATVPGIPAIISGRSDVFGWGITASYMDTEDVFIEQENPDNPAQLRDVEGWANKAVHRTILRIKDQDPITLTLEWSQNGPIIPGHHFNLASITPPGHVAALGWTLLTGNDKSMSAALRLMRAKTVDQGIEAGRDFVGPSLNIVMADAQGIAMKTVGAAPRRAAQHMTRGRMPAPGWRIENRWLGLESYDSNPVFANPIGGIIVNTNNKILERPFPQHVSFDWGDTQRIQRIARLMQSREVHTRESFIEAQLDTVSVTARTLLPLVGADLWFTGDPAPEGTPERRRQDALSLLADWNGEMSEHMPEPLIYMAWMRALQEGLIRDDLGPLAARFTHLDPVFVERVFRNIDGAGAWCDVVQSAPVETCTDIARRALDGALLWIDEHQGGDQVSLRWGNAHQARHDHLVLGEVPLLKWFVNIQQSTSGGDNTLNRGLTRGKGAAPFDNVHGAIYRGVYDFADPNSSLFVSSTGQSGHFLSRHYDDLGELWRRGEYVPMSLDQALARAAAVGITTLTPAQ
ncbi:MAG: penicillin acylase family protein [Maritimibacter sp.]